MSHPALDHFFNPAGVAVVGASADPAKAGHQILHNLVRLAFGGRVYPVNPKETEVLGLRCYADLRDIPSPVDLIVVAVPAEHVLGVFEAARARGDVRAAVILSAGFSETQEPDRVALEKRVAALAAGAGIRVLGPNCVGVMNTAVHLDTTFAPNVNQVPGGMSILTQSGSLGASILMFAGDQPVPMGFSKYAHVGNMCDVDLLDILRYYQNDPETKVIAAYMEGINNARRFMETAAAVTREKPIIALKVGKTADGSTAANSHTGSLAGADAVYDGAFEQAGVVRVGSVEELLDSAKALSMQPLPRDGRICILTEAGGPGIIAMDAFCEAGQGRLAPLSPKTIADLKAALPSMAIIDRPTGYIDMTAAADEEQQARALDVVLADKSVDGVILLTVPPTFLDPTDLGRRLVGLAGRHGKPVLSCFMAGNWVREARQAMEAAGLPTFDMPDRVARAMSNLVKRATLLKRLPRDEGEATGAVSVPPAGADAGPTERTPVGVADIGDLLAVAADQGPTEVIAREVLKRCGLDTGRWAAAAGPNEAMAAAAAVGYPVVLKVVSPQVIHKSDVGGVALGLKTPEALAAAVEQMARRVPAAVPGADIQGYLIAHEAPRGTEVIVGATRDSQMGPVVMFGIGGVLTELYKDVVFRMAPVDRPTAEAMILSVRAAALLQGYRGEAPVDLATLAGLVVKVSEIIAANPGIGAIELNPVRVRADGLDVLDARLVV